MCEKLEIYDESEAHSARKCCDRFRVWILWNMAGCIELMCDEINHSVASHHLLCMAWRFFALEQRLRDAGIGANKTSRKRCDICGTLTSSPTPCVEFTCTLVVCLCFIMLCEFFLSSLHRIFAFDAPDIYLEYMNKNLIEKNTQNKKLWNFFSALLVLISWKCETLRQGEWELGDMIDVVESHFGNEKRARSYN